MKKQIIITIENDQVSLSTNGHITYSDATEVLATAQLLFFNSVIKTATADAISTTALTNLKEKLWSDYNVSASNALDEMIPNHVRPDLTEEAILKMENEILKSNRAKAKPKKKKTN